MNERVLKMDFSKIYSMYIAKVEKKGRDKSELDYIIYWLTGHDEYSLRSSLDKGVSVGEFFSTFPHLNDNAYLIKGLICGHRVEEITDPLEKNIRYLDKIVDELAKGKTIEKIMRS